MDMALYWLPRIQKMDKKMFPVLQKLTVRNSIKDAKMV